MSKPKTSKAKGQKIEKYMTVHVSRFVDVPGFPLNTDEKLTVEEIRKQRGGDRVLVRRPSRWGRSWTYILGNPDSPPFNSGYAWLYVSDLDLSTLTSRAPAAVPMKKTDKRIVGGRIVK